MNLRKEQSINIVSSMEKKPIGETFFMGFNVDVYGINSTPLLLPLTRQGSRAIIDKGQTEREAPLNTIKTTHSGLNYNHNALKITCEGTGVIPEVLKITCEGLNYNLKALKITCGGTEVISNALKIIYEGLDYISRALKVVYRPPYQIKYLINDYRTIV